MTPSKSLAFGQFSLGIRRGNGYLYVAPAVDRVNPPAPIKTGCLNVLPQLSWNITGDAGGPFSPAMRIFTLTNIGGSTMSWTATKAQAWLLLDVAAGTLEPGESVDVTATLDANALTDGSYSDSIQFVNTTNACGDYTANVSLTVGAGLDPAINDFVVSQADGVPIFTVPGFAGFDPGDYVWVVSIDGGATWIPSSSYFWLSPSSESLTVGPGGNEYANGFNGLKVRLSVGTNTSDVGTMVCASGLSGTVNGNPLDTSIPCVNLGDAVTLSIANDSAWSTPLTGCTYQWEQSLDAGATWAPLANAGIFSGVTTQTLAISAVGASEANDVGNPMDPLKPFRCRVTFGAETGDSSEIPFYIGLWYNCPP